MATKRRRLATGHSDYHSAIGILAWMAVLLANPALGESLVHQDDLVDTPYRVTVGENQIPVEIGTHVVRSYTARFRYEAGGRVIVHHPGWNDVVFKPARFSDSATYTTETVSFEMTDASPTVIKAPGQPPLFIIPTSAANPPDNADRITPNSDAKAHTLRIQAAIDQASGQGGGTVYLEPGIHESRTLTLRSNVALHVSEGATLLGTGIPEDYDAEHGRRALILVKDAVGASIRGHGVIDGRGHVIQKEHETKAHLINALNAKDLTVTEVTLQNPGAWTLHLIGCENVDIRGIKIVADWGLGNTDGIDPDMSRNVTIEDCFVCSGDDAIVVKATGVDGVKKPSTDITARNCFLMTHKTALKIGTESRYDIRNVLYEDIEIFDSSRACALWMRDGATYADIIFRNITANLMRIEEERWSGEAYRVSIQERDGRGRMERILFDNIRIRSPFRSIVRSRLDYPVSGVTFSKCVWVGDSLEDIPGIEVNNAEGILMRDCRVEIHGERSDYPRELIVGTTPEGIAIE